MFDFNALFIVFDRQTIFCFGVYPVLANFLKWWQIAMAADDAVLLMLLNLLQYMGARRVKHWHESSNCASTYEKRSIVYLLPMCKFYQIFQDKYSVGMNMLYCANGRCQPPGVIICQHMLRGLACSGVIIVKLLNHCL